MNDKSKSPKNFQPLWDKDKTEAKTKAKVYSPEDNAKMKIEIEQFKKAITEKMKSPNLAKKAAHLLSLWLTKEGISKSASKDSPEKEKNSTGQSTPPLPKKKAS